MLLRVLQQNELPKIDAFNNAHDCYWTVWRLSLNWTTKMNFFLLFLNSLLAVNMSIVHTFEKGPNILDAKAAALIWSEVSFVPWSWVCEVSLPLAAFSLMPLLDSDLSEGPDRPLYLLS